ncbi:hypothetical protein PQX77_003498 [Marasmius sp. AFHP31]|nr:hypothetical protein PQX77_003498 [Marasmius sp. AFHP31]
MGGFAFYDANGNYLFRLWDPEFSEHFKSDKEGKSKQETKLAELGATSQVSCLLEHCVATRLINITEDEISGLSSTDAIGKLLTIFQTLYFIASCIARGAQRLAITELEFLTLGFAALNLVSYSFWWHKPSRVQFPVHVIDRAQSADVVSIPSALEPVDQKRSNCSFITGPITTFRNFLSGISAAFAGRIREDYCGGKKSGESGASNVSPLYFLVVVPLLAFTRLFTYAFSADAADRSQPERGNIFSASTIAESKSPLAYALVYSTAVVLGVFHCIPIMVSYSDFPGHNRDHHLWTGFAIVMTVLPLGVGIAHVRAIWSAKTEKGGGSIALQGALILVFVLSYSTARIALTVLAVKQLTDLPTSALRQVEWTDWIPHFGI